MDSPSLSQSSYSQPLPPTVTLTTHFTQKNYCFLKDLKEKKNQKKNEQPFLYQRGGNINIEILGNVGLRLDGKEPTHQSRLVISTAAETFVSIPEKEVRNRLLTMQLTQLFTLFHRTETEIRNSELTCIKPQAPVDICVCAQTPLPTVGS